MEKVQIKTERLLLRPLGTKDLEAFYAYASDVENTRYMIYFPHRDREQTREFLTAVEAEWEKESPSFYEFSILADGVQIGTASVYPEGGEGCGELAWMLHKAYWHRGYATEAAEAVRDFAFASLGLKKLYAHCDSRNLASARVMERLGMVRECEQERVYSDERGAAREYRYFLPRQQ